MFTKNGKRCPTVLPDAILGFFGDYQFLSNYHASPIRLDDLRYPTAEHAYVAQKSDTFKLRAFIASLPTPAAAHRFGQTIQLPCHWGTQRLGAMRRVLDAKFENPSLRSALCATGARRLEGTNNWGDELWGVCKGSGDNQLGLLLMELRALLQQAG